MGEAGLKLQIQPHTLALLAKRDTPAKSKLAEGQKVRHTTPVCQHMARLQGMLDYLRAVPDEAAAAAAPVGRRDDGQFGPLLLDAGRVLMLWGWGLLATAVSTAGNRPADAADATHAFLSLLLWLIGVSLVTFTPAARRRFPRVARRGTAVSNVVMGCFFPPWN